MKVYFITATGTGIGKTLLTCALAHQLRAQGVRVWAVKPVISGFDMHDTAASDTGLLLAAQTRTLSPQAIDAVSPWRFLAPLSPDMAAQDEGRTIDFERLIAFCRKQDEADIVLIESVGGLMTPLDASRTVLDWAMALGYPVILAAGSYLGSLSHTLTCARVVQRAALMLHAVVVSESESSTVPLPRTLATLRRFLPPDAQLESISRLDSSPHLWKYVPDLTHMIL